MGSGESKGMPTKIVEPHHHYTCKEDFHGTTKDLGIADYSPEDFVRDMEGVNVQKAIHMEIMPTSGLGEAEWLEQVIEKKRSPVVGIVAGCNLAAADAPAQLEQLKSKCPHVVGIRYILDYAGPFGEAPATHVNLSRHSADGSVGPPKSGKGIDFLRDPAWATKFEAGFAELAKHNFRFDLQCAPVQLQAAADIIERHPDVPVVIDHLGKPRHDGIEADDAATLETWRKGMERLAKSEHVYLKLSMLGYSVPGWTADAEKEKLVASLVLEMIKLFGPKRCMFSTNWWSCGLGNSDGRDELEITMAELWRRYYSWVKDFPQEDVELLFSGTAEKFYGI